MFLGRTEAEDEALIFWPPDAKSWLTGKDLDAGKDWRPKEKGVAGDEMIKRALLTQWTWTWTNSRRWWKTGELGVLQSIRSQRLCYNSATEQQIKEIGITKEYHRQGVRRWKCQCLKVLSSKPQSKNQSPWPDWEQSVGRKVEPWRKHCLMAYRCMSKVLRACHSLTCIWRMW